MSKNESALEQFEKSKSKLTQESTNLIAASIIAHKDFPRKERLPQFKPLPFHSFGQFFLFDHSKFLLIVYQAVIGIKKISKKRKYLYLPRFTSLGIIVIGCGMLILQNITLPLAFVFIIIVAALGNFIVAGIMEKTANEQIADYKARLLENLLNNTWEKENDLDVPAPLLNSFNLSLSEIVSNEEIKVLTTFGDQQPFPGFGMLQLDNKFICPPKDLKNITQNEEEDLFKVVIDKLQDLLGCSGISNIGFEKVVAINSETIYNESPWLNEEKIPFLKVPTYKNKISLQDKNASVRIYYVVEVLLPRYDSAACFFIRPFKAENSVGCHIALTTLGPPQNDRFYLEEKLRKYNKEKDKPGLTSDDIIHKDSASYNLNIIWKNSRAQEKFHETISFSDLADIDDLREKPSFVNLDKKKTQEIIENEVRWPGRYRYMTYNVREINSLTLGGDFFGHPEVISTIDTIYDQISRTVLESIEEQGFDISKYKDKDGKLFINADRIDKLIVGEVIKISDKEKKQSKNDVEKTEVSTPK